MPPCRLDKELFREIGDVLESRSPELYKTILNETINEFKEDLRFARRKARKYAKEYLESIKETYMPVYALTSPNKDIESYESKQFIEAKWPSDTENISIQMGRTLSPLRVVIDLRLESSEMDRSRVSVSGRDATLVHGTTDQLANLFEEKKLGYHVIVKYWPIRVLISVLIIGFILLSAGVILPQVLPVNPTILGVFLVLGVSVLDRPLRWLFPRFEFGENPRPKRFRKLILGLLSGSGLISAIILRFLGLQ